MPTNKPRIDIHCHLFTAKQFAEELLVYITARLSEFLKGKKKREERGRQKRGIVDDIKENIEDIQKVINFFTILGMKNSKKIYKKLKSSYKEDIILAPLMMDVIYGVTPLSREKKPPVRRETATQDSRYPYDTMNRIFMEQINGITIIIEDLEKRVVEGEEKYSPSIRKKIQTVKKAFLAETEKIKENYALPAGARQPGNKHQPGGDTDPSARSLEGNLHEGNLHEGSLHEKNLAEKKIPQGRYPLEKSGFYHQMKELEELQRAFPGSVYPFLAVDPRREGIESLVKEKVGKGKPFTGIKLYPALGYLPSHPVLMEIFSYCEKDRIPITVHCAPGVVTTFLYYGELKGFILKSILEHLGQTDRASKIIEGYEFVEVDQLVKLPDFREGDFIHILEKRSSIYGDPLNWLPVLEEYKHLNLNLAHFGGGIQLTKYFHDNNDTSSWTYKITSILKNENYPNVYTDISFFDDASTINYVNTLLDNDPTLLDKIMYGSDFMLIMLAEKTFDDYFNPFKDTARLKEEYFNRMSLDNPAAFLGLEER